MYIGNVFEAEIGQNDTPSNDPIGTGYCDFHCPNQVFLPVVMGDQDGTMPITSGPTYHSHPVKPTGGIKWRTYYYAAGQRIATRETTKAAIGAPYYLLSDHLGSTTVTVDNNGVRAGEQFYKAWGEVDTNRIFGNTPTKRGYTGQYQAEIGLMFYQARFYDPYIIRSGIQYAISDYPGNDHKLLSFDISETDPLWETVFALLKKYQGFDIYRGGDIYDTFFSDDEIRQAEWVRIVSTFEQGYPQPAGNWPFKQSSLSITCPSCAIYDQISPMRISKEPSLRKNAFMSLIGVSELFATPEVFSGLNSIGATGYDTWEVLIHKTNQQSEKIHQLYIPSIAKPGLLGTEEMRQVRCQKCGTVKYYPHKRGVMRLKQDALAVDTDFIKTFEWFGVGLISYKEIIVSNRVASFILEKGWVGIRFKVVELV